jgi:glucose-1-phosphate cytidylyltransferase
MKVVLFCGGLGLRLREYSESIPKPMVPIGHRPILWHVMKYYAHFGHKEFILCLGWQGSMIKEYFLNYNECMSNDFVLTQGGAQVKLLSSDIHDWQITFVDTGVASNIGQRLKAVEPHLEGEETFLANYSDGLCDLHLPELIDYHRRHDAIATFVAVRPKQSIHQVNVGDDGHVRNIAPIHASDVWINGGYFVLNRQIFDYIGPQDELVVEPFQRLIAAGRLAALKYEGFWGCMDTYKEKQTLDDMAVRGDTPWELWKHQRPAPRRDKVAPLPAVAAVG